MKSRSRFRCLFFIVQRWCALGGIVALASRGLAEPAIHHVVAAANRGPLQTFQLNQPKAVAVDPMGNLYIADTENDRVLLRTPSGQVSVILASPLVKKPSGIAVEANGYLYVADTGNNRILCKASNGPVMICVFGFLNQPTGLAFDGSANLYIADTGFSRVIRRTPKGEICIVRTDALDHPMGVAADTRSIYIADYGKNRILRRALGCEPSESSIVALANQPAGVAVNMAGELFIAEFMNNVVLRRTPAGESSRFAGGGTMGCTVGGVPATTAMLNRPTGLTLDGAGNLYIADTGNNCIRRVDPRGIITTIL